jgi:hypothetical protein
MEETKTPEEIQKEAKRIYDKAYYKANADWIREKCRAAYWRRKANGRVPNSPRILKN